MLEPLLRPNPTVPKSMRATALNLAAICSLSMNRIADAETFWRRAIKEKPDFAEAYNNLAIVCMQGNRLAEAEEFCGQALAIRPDYADAHNTLGNVLTNLNRLPEAEAACRQAVAIRPDYAQAHYSLGNVLYRLRRLTEAEIAYRRAVEIHPGYAEAYSNLGNVLGELHRLPEAVEAYQRAVSIHPGYAEIYSNLARALRQLKCLPEAESACRRALAIRPDLADAQFNLGNILADLDHLVDAEAAFRHALALRPGYSEAQNNLGSTLYALNRLSDAEVAYRQALTTSPNYPDARVGLAGLLLSIGKFAEGWRFYEARSDEGNAESNTIPPNVTFPQWRGEPLQGKSVVVWHEQGYGDMIQFGRYLSQLKALGAARITLAYPRELHRLFAALPYVDDVVDSAAALAELNHHFWTFPLSIPLYCGTTLETIPSALYLKAESEWVTEWRERLAPLTGHKIGVVWKGSPTHKNDRHRSLPSLATLAPLWSVPGVSFVSLQKGPAEAELTPSSRDQPIWHFGVDIKDFADTAAIIDQLDLVICVDTAIAHLAGAMGKQCWVLLADRGTDWRWMHERADSPWYPDTVRLLRKSAQGDWSGTIAQLTQACIETFCTVGSAG